MLKDHPQGDGNGVFDEILLRCHGTGAICLSHGAYRQLLYLPRRFIMKRRFSTRLIAMLLVFVFAVFLVPVQASANVSNCTVTLAKSYNKDGKFCMEIHFGLSSVSYMMFEIFLTDQGGDVITRWDNIMVGTYINDTLKYVFSRDYSTTPDGKYTMNVVATDASGNSSNYAWGVNHKKVVSVSFLDTYQVKNDDGSYSQKFRFSTLNGKGKTYHLEIYTKDGAYITSFETVGKYDKSTWSETWNYYPDSGVKMKSGTYILKYWADDGNPKQETVSLTI
jgi:archaellum component FlaF (FlaF/FlaG flagellin family)